MPRKRKLCIRTMMNMLFCLIPVISASAGGDHMPWWGSLPLDHTARPTWAVAEKRAGGAGRGVARRLCKEVRHGAGLPPATASPGLLAAPLTVPAVPSHNKSAANLQAQLLQLVGGKHTLNCSIFLCSSISQARIKRKKEITFSHF